MRKLVLRRKPTRAARPVQSPAPAGREQVAEILGYPLQTKLKLGAPDDAHEREADAVAERVMAMPEPLVQRQCADCAKEDEEKKSPPPEAERKDEEVQRKSKVGNTGMTTADAAEIASSRGSGQPLPRSERTFFENRFGRDLSAVNIHANAEAERLSNALSARAFTVGQDVYFARGEYQPGSREGRRLLAHELAHVQQQESGGVSAQRKIDKVDVAEKRIDLYVSIGIYGSRATKSLASKWKRAIEKNWSRKLKYADVKIDANVHATVKAYPNLADSTLMQIMVDESNAVFVEATGFRSVVDGSCVLLDDYSCGSWAADAADLVVAHETGHLMGLLDQYVDKVVAGNTVSTDKPGYEKDIMANFWNDNGQTDFTRAWLGALIFYYLGSRT